VIWTVVSKMNH